MVPVIFSFYSFSSNKGNGSPYIYGRGYRSSSLFLQRTSYHGLLKRCQILCLRERPVYQQAATHRGFLIFTETDVTIEQRPMGSIYLLKHYWEHHPADNTLKITLTLLKNLRLNFAALTI